MFESLQLPHYRRTAREAPGRVRRTTLVPAIIAVSLLASAAQVVGSSIEHPARDVRATSRGPALPAEERLSARAADQAIVPTVCVEVPPAAVAAISL